MFDEVIVRKVIGQIIENDQGHKKSDRRDQSYFADSKDHFGSRYPARPVPRREKTDFTTETQRAQRGKIRRLHRLCRFRSEFRFAGQLKETTGEWQFSSHGISRP